MVYLADLVITQNSLYTRIKNVYANFVDKYQDDYDIFRVDSHLELLDKNWEEFKQNHEFIISKKSDNTKDNHYYKNLDQYFADVQEFYSEKVKFMSAKQAKYPYMLSVNMNKV